LPIEVPVTSTNCPTRKWSAVISAPTGIIASSLTRNSAIVRLGSTLATAKAAALGLAHVLHLAGAGTELQRDVAVLSPCCDARRPGIAQDAAR
jgi:hypothetical protein